MTLADLPLIDETRPLLLLGCGKMGTALLEGWIAGGLPGGHVSVTEPAPSPELQALLGGCGAEHAADFAQLARTPGAILAAIKPQMMGEVIPDIAARFGAAPLYISIAAGTGIAFFEDAIGAGARIVRVMPNTPAAVGRGASALFANAACGASEREVAARLLEAAGLAVWIESEAQMDAVTAVSGSGPAYVFHMIEALAAAGEAEGLAPGLALALARQTVIGAAALAEQSGLPAETLRRNVTSPGGTTAAALEVLMAEGDSGLRAVMTRAVRAAAQRSRELG